MNAEDIAKLVGELEERIERLRVLYDQYFMGIEKIPPEVLKKDVERRMWILRREKIRNTGTRFKFQMITQRLNTFQSYWMRICRDIENGTYKRDLIRAKRRFGPDATADQVREGARVENDVPPNETLDLHVELGSDDLVPENETLEAEFPDLFPEATRPAARASARPPARGAPPPRPAPTPPAPPSMLVAGPHPQGAVFGRIALQARPRPAVDDHSGAPTAPIGAPRPPFDRAQAAPAPGLARPIRDDGDLDTMLDGALGASGTVASAPQTRVPRVAPVTVEAPPRTSAPTASRPRNSASDKSDPDRQIYNKLVDAKRANGESTANLTFEQLQRNLDAARAKLMGKSGGRSIDFDVVVKDGKTILKPTVK